MRDLFLRRLQTKRKRIDEKHPGLGDHVRRPHQLLLQMGVRMCQTKTKTTPPAQLARPETTTTPETTKTRHDANAHDDGGIDEGHGTDHCTSQPVP